MIKNCSLCLMAFDNEDPDYIKRIERHNIWHIKANVQHRNTACGIPKYE